MINVGTLSKHAPDAHLRSDQGFSTAPPLLGTPEGVVLKAQGMSMRVRLDEDTLKKAAKLKTPDLRQYPLTTLIKLLPRNW